jgi:hypothetical protein
MAQPRKSFTTQKGTELTLLNLKGKEYLTVANRLVWFREQHPTAVLRTQMLEKNGEGQDEFCIFKAEVHLETERGPMLVATAHKRESRKDFPDFIEKCETSAIGRALALIGFGTQFAADELDEGMRLADAPVDVVSKGTSESSSVAEAVTTPRRSSFRKNVSAPEVSVGDDL